MFTAQQGVQPTVVGIFFSALCLLFSATPCPAQQISSQPLAVNAVASTKPQSDAAKEKVLLTFPGGGKGGSPTGKLLFDSTGNLYGTTSAGGGFNTNCPNGWCGTVFELTPAVDGKWKETVLHDFSGLNKNGAVPFWGVIFDNAGNLYGTAADGGHGKCFYRGCGVAFKLTRNDSGKWQETVLYGFTGGKDGGEPGPLILDKQGNLYGVAEAGGKAGCGGFGCGVVFELTPTASGRWKQTVLYAFPGGRAGANPYGGLMFDAAGNLYGATLQGGGANGYGMIFELVPDGKGKWERKVLHFFAKTKEGVFPNGSLISDGVGNLYGTTRQGGNDTDCQGMGCGVVFELTPTARGMWKETVLHTFSGGKDGAGPADLTFDTAGDLYSTTYAGGINNCGGGSGCGVLFKLTPDANGKWRETVLYSFTGGTDGGNPASDLVFAAGGNLYGSTTAGGPQDWGVIFKVKP